LDNVLSPVGVSLSEKFWVSPVEPDPVGALRRDAWVVFDRLPWPTKEDEAWRRTDLSRLSLDQRRLIPIPFAVAPQPPSSFLGGGEGECRLLWGADGLSNAPSSSLENQGVLFLGLTEALQRVPHLVLPHLGKILPAGQGKFQALSLAVWSHGAFVFVPKNVTAAVVLRTGTSLNLREGQTLATRTLVVAEPGARVTLIEDHASTGSNGLSVHGTELVVGENAHVTYVSLQRLGTEVDHFALQNARVGAGGQLTTLVMALGGRVSRGDFGSRLEGAGAQAGLYGLVFGNGAQRFTHNTWQEHVAPHTTSDLLFKAALTDESRSVYTGMIRIEKNAGQSKAYQSSKNVLLSRNARAHALPMLEILTDDVQCGHGAAVGSLDDDQKFYLMSRGLSTREAERMIVEGFFEDVLSRVPTTGVRESLQNAIDLKLGQPL